jgi:hypothetical protein
MDGIEARTVIRKARTMKTTKTSIRWKSCNSSDWICQLVKQDDGPSGKILNNLVHMARANHDKAMVSKVEVEKYFAASR